MNETGPVSQLVRGPGRPKSDLPIERLLAAIRVHGSVAQACRDIGVVERTFMRRYMTDPDLGRRVEAARQEGREASFVHGTPGSRSRCRCEICRFADALRKQPYRPSQHGDPCGHCGRIVGRTKHGLRYAHHSEPGVMCPASQRGNSTFKLPSAS